MIFTVLNEFLMLQPYRDQCFLQYFPEYDFVYAHDPQKVCRTGDTVLLKKLPERMTTLITHKVDKVVYPLGDVTDPVTGKKVAFTHYQ